MSEEKKLSKQEKEQLFHELLESKKKYIRYLLDLARTGNVTDEDFESLSSHFDSHQKNYGKLIGKYPNQPTEHEKQLDIGSYSAYVDLDGLRDFVLFEINDNKDKTLKNELKDFLKEHDNEYEEEDEEPERKSTKRKRGMRGGKQSRSKQSSNSNRISKIKSKSVLKSKSVRKSKQNKTKKQHKKW
jgi:hypothetical protein